MMKLRFIGLMLDIEEFPCLYGSDFGFRARYIGNYLGRLVKAANFTTTEFNAIVIRGYHQPADRSYIVSEKSLRAPVHFDQARYDNLGPDEHHEFFLGMYIEGIEKANRDFPIPYDVLMQGIEDFRKGGYKNEWVYKRKLLRQFGLHASLVFDMDTHRFRARLLLERKGQRLCEPSVIETKPDELCYAYKVKEIAVEGNNIVVKNEFGEKTFSLDVNTLV